MQLVNGRSWLREGGDWQTAIVSVRRAVTSGTFARPTGTIAAAAGPAIHDPVGNFPALASTAIPIAITATSPA
ncbi:hypothetical protein SAMN05216559_0148 [Halomicrobium zhouii]|uniref:Uncharacterized protein n=1 Tax=Halomicrobium zhouii TaxID=767519 RepID=A0A1I6K3Q6_9EURY|nr:hypothetical protein SAMN05216559_0148 [Halomicrobium zhouii]